MNRISAGIAGLCFLGCIGIVVLAYVSAMLRTHGPALREFTHWLVTPQFCLGALAMSVAVAAFGLALSWSDAP